MKITRSNLLKIIKEELDLAMSNNELDKKRAKFAQIVADHYDIDFQRSDFIKNLMAEEDSISKTAHIDNGAIYQNDLASIISRKWAMDELQSSSEYIFDDPHEELASLTHSEILLDHPFFDAYYDKENQEFVPDPIDMSSLEQHKNLF